jgi:hypothetical protein
VRRRRPGRPSRLARVRAVDDGHTYHLLEIKAAELRLRQLSIEGAAKALEPGTSAALIVFENSWAAPLASALRRSGGQLVASGRIPVQAVLAALDAAEEAESVGTAS